MLSRRPEVTLANKTEQIPDEQRSAFGQSVALGDTGDGDTGVPAGEQGISNRPADHAQEVAAQEEDDEELGGDLDEDSEEDDEDDDLDGDEDEEKEEDE
jgi:hypothetical protein